MSGKDLAHPVDDGAGIFMAVILDISKATVDSYIRRLFKKLRVNDRISAVIVGLSNSLIKLT